MEAARFVTSLPQPIVLVGHLDTDGLCATAIMARALERLSIEHSVKIVPQISTVFLKKLSGGASYIFLDGGSTHLKSLSELFAEPVLIIDHHAPGGEPAEKHFLLNPLLDKLDGSREICTATISYLLAKELDVANGDVAHLAVVGTIGDAHEKGGVIGPNKEALDEALSSGSVSIMMAPRFFGVFSKPLTKLLASSHDLKVPGITKDYHGSRRLLQELGIPERDGTNKRTYA
ncbi:DHH family phosphoesterase, partial [Candidatus Woesearchaeota archaeon]|nr:DHH family phosphoesterase [Candidatus Woesearchaeota archaeon]